MCVHHWLKRLALMELLNDWIRNILYFSTFLIFGMTIGMAGPALMDLLLIYFEELDVIDSLAWLLFSQALSRFVGAITAGVMTDRFKWNYNAILSLSLFFNALLQAAIPLSRKLWLLLMLTAVSGLFAGVVDTVTNVALVRLHGIKVSPYLQSLYFCYGFGAFISPLISEPFLSEKRDKAERIKTKFQMDYMSSNESEHYPSIIIHTALDKAPFREPEYWSKNPGRIEVAFWIVGALHVPVIFGLSFVTLLDKLKSVEDLKVEQHRVSNQSGERENKSPSMQLDGDDDENESYQGSLTSSEKTLHEDSFEKRNTIAITAWTSVVVFIFDGLQGTFGGYIFTYAMEINMSESQGAILTSLFWGSLAVGRLLSILFSVYCAPRNMLKMSLVCSLLSTASMTCFHNSSLAIWLGTSLFALSMSNVFPCCLAMIELYFPVTGTIACAFVVSAAVGETIIPLLVGELFDRMGTLVFMICAVVLCSLAFISFGILSIIAAGKGNLRTSDGFY